MADHIRAQLVAAVKTAVTSLATTGSNVFGFRVNPLQGAELPGLCVYTLSDEATADTIHAPVLYGREIELHVAGYAAANASLDETLDAIAKEVETALGVVLTVATKPVLLTYRGMTKEFAAGERQAGEIDIRFTASLGNLANTPDVIS